MFRLSCLLLLSCSLISLHACRSESSNTNHTSSDSTTIPDTAPPVGNFYKRYSGTIGGKEIVLHLHCYDGAVHGNYQYLSIGQTINLHNWEDTVVSDDKYYLLEAPATESRDTLPQAHWLIAIHGPRVTGTWTKGGVEYPIELTEQYPEGSSRLSASYLADSSELIQGTPTPKATKSYSYLLPPDNSNPYLLGEIVHMMVPEAPPQSDIVEALRADIKSYFDTYRSDNAGLVKKGGALEALSLNYTSDEVLSVLYNDEDLLVVEDQSSDYTGGAHGNYSSTFSNIDVRGQHLWTITDIVTDTSALRPLLNDAAITYFRLKPGEDMDQRMLVEEVPPTGNVYLSNTGLTFVYNPYEIASYADGQVSLFIPYRKLMPLLNPAFKDRLKLQERAGVALLSVLH